MTKLTDSQLILLSRATQRDDGVLEDAGAMKAGAASKVAGALIRKKLMREVRSKPGMPVWRQDEDGRNVSLLITRAGRKAIHVEDDGKESAAADAKSAEPANRTIRRKGKAAQTNLKSQTQIGGPAQLPGVSIVAGTNNRECAISTRQTKPGSKLALIVLMLQRTGGASVPDMMEATGWLPHSIRAAMTGLRKRGFDIGKAQTKGELTIFRIDPAVTSADQGIAA